MVQMICEAIMLVCFGLSWPISVYKSITSRATKGKSAVFIMAIIIGYIAGITGKIVGNQFDTPWKIFVFVLYCFNLIMVSTDLTLFFINRRNEKKNEQ
ncbi:MAG: hypothetical protein J6B34_02355 [Clostridia bacterium]|nr:hypothetical protein [Clostridia bacterium]